MITKRLIIQASTTNTRCSSVVLVFTLQYHALRNYINVYCILVSLDAQRKGKGIKFMTNVNYMVDLHIFSVFPIRYYLFTTCRHLQ